VSNLTTFSEYTARLSYCFRNWEIIVMHISTDALHLFMSEAAHYNPKTCKNFQILEIWNNTYMAYVTNLTINWIASFY
jgi:hypothetical protein